MEHHHQFHFIKRTDSKLSFINILGLMFISLIPFSTALVGDYGQLRLPALIFEGNLLLAGLVFYVHWLYATSRRLVDPGITPHVIEYYKRRNLIIPLISIAAILLSLTTPRWGTVFYITVPFIMIWYRLGSAFRAY